MINPVVFRLDRLYRRDEPESAQSARPGNGHVQGSLDTDGDDKNNEHCVRGKEEQKM